MLDKIDSFAEYLTRYVEKKQLTWKRAAELCGLERSLLRRYSMGERRPRHTEQVKKIAKGLGMSLDETKEFIDFYEKAAVSKSEQSEYAVLDALLKGELSEKMPTISEWRDAVPVSGNTVSRIMGKREFGAAAKKLVQEASFIRLSVGENCAEQLLSLIFERMSASCALEQILELNNAEAEQVGMDIFGRLVPYLFAGRIYRIFCHYGWENGMSGNVYQTGMLCSDKAVILFHGDMEDAIAAWDRAYVDYYGQVFERVLKKCVVFGGSEKFPDNLPVRKLTAGYSKSDISVGHETGAKERIWIRRREDAFFVEEVEIVDRIKKLMRSA